MLSRFAYEKARSVEDAVRALERGARLHAGGTDLLGCLRDGVFTADRVVSLSGLDELRGIRWTPDGGLRLGALVTLAEIAGDSSVRERYRALSDAAASAASPQLRNQGTLGGNLCQRPRCWYFRGDFHCTRKGGDMCYAAGGENRYHCLFGGDGCFIVHPSDTAPALEALGAHVRIVGPRGARTMPIESLFVLPAQDRTRETVLEPAEVVTEILLPPAATDLRSTYRKIRERGAWDFALVSVALAVRTVQQRVTEARVVLGGVAPVPWRSPAAERALTGRALNATVAARAAAAAVESAQPMEQNEYKVPLLRGAVEQAVLAL
jgi:xanthine dehydrogenase YagS FAD-binding subunit